MLAIKNKSGTVLYNCSSTYLTSLVITNIESRSYTFRCLNKSDCDSFESLRSYSNPYFAKQNFLRGAKLVADNSSNQTNSIEIELSGNSSVYSGKGVIYEISPEINAGYKINDRIYTVSLYWIGNDWGTELRKGLYRVDL